MAQFTRQFNTPDADIANPDRWYYNAVLSNPATGDTNDVLGRYVDQRTVPLMDSCAGYYVALGRLSVTGATASLPILVPPVRNPSAAQSNTVITDLHVGLRYTVYATSAPTVPVAYSELKVVNLQFPSLYPTESRQDPFSKFYWMDSAVQVQECINLAIQSLASSTGVTFTSLTGGTYLSGGQVIPAASLPFYNGTMPFYVELDKGTYRMMVHAPYSTTTQTVQFPSNVYQQGGQVGNFLVVPHLSFSDKLLELIPMEVYPAVETRARGSTQQSGIQWMHDTPSWLTSPQRRGDGGAMYFLALVPPLADGISAGGASPYNFDPTVCQYEMLFNQEYENTSAWSPFTGLAITSNIIPAVEEASGINITPTSGAVQASGNSSVNIIFDLDLTQDTIHQLQSGIAFTPAAYRWAKLKSSALSGIDLNFFLRKRDGTYIPWNLTNGGTISAKLMFCRNPY